MPETRHKIQLDRAHALKLLRGEPIALKIPDGAKVLEIHAPAVATREPLTLDNMSEQIDQLFGRIKFSR